MIYQQAGAYILMLNTGLRTGELLGLLSSDIDLENKTMTIRQAVKLVDQRDGTKLIGGKVKKVGKTKTTTSKRVVPLNYFGAKNILRELKNILAELFSTGEIDRIDETK